MTHKDDDTKDASKGSSVAAIELTAALAAVAAGTPGALKRLSRAQEAKAQADRRKAALGA